MQTALRFPLIPRLGHTQGIICRLGTEKSGGYVQNLQGVGEAFVHLYLISERKYLMYIDKVFQLCYYEVVK